MELFLAWQALTTGPHFFLYLVLAALILLVHYKSLIGAYWDYTGQDQSEKIKWLLQLDPKQAAAKKNSRTRWQVNLLDVIMELKHDKKWCVGKEGEALMVAGVLQALGHIKALTPITPSPTSVQALYHYINAQQYFVEVSGQEAQAIANHGHLVVALSLSNEDQAADTAALVIPGEVYPGSALAKNNPMVLWITRDAVMELQAAAAFSQQQPVRYMTIRQPSK